MSDGQEIEGIVSLWVGRVDCRDALDRYTEMDYSIAGDSPLSQFAREFNTGWYDDDFLERDVCERPTRSLRELLRGCSYDNVLIPKFVEICGELLPSEANAFVLLYNFQHNGSVGAGIDTGGPVKLRYMGSITVEMPWSE